MRHLWVFLLFRRATSISNLSISVHFSSWYSSTSTSAPSSYNFSLFLGNVLVEFSDSSGNRSAAHPFFPRHVYATLAEDFFSAQARFLSSASTQLRNHYPSRPGTSARATRPRHARSATSRLLFPQHLCRCRTAAVCDHHSCIPCTSTDLITSPSPSIAQKDTSPPAETHPSPLSGRATMEPRRPLYTPHL